MTFLSFRAGGDQVRAGYAPDFGSSVRQITVLNRRTRYISTLPSGDRERIIAMSQSKTSVTIDKDILDVQTLRDDEFHAVIAGFSAISSAISEVMKNFGGALQTAARGG